MLSMREVEKLFRVTPGTRLRLKDHETDWSGDEDLRRLTSDELRETAKTFIVRNLAELADAQERLFANDVYSVLVVLQAMDAAGKDGMVKHVMSGLNPQGCQVFSFKRPSEDDLDHNFLWRYTRALPERGRIGIFNRSYYEETLIVRVHPDVLERQRLPAGKRGKDFWQRRYDDINAFEQHLTNNGTLVLKFFLHISKKEQRKRFLERLDNPAKHWKFNVADLHERAYWDDYRAAYEDTITQTSTEVAPWWVIPADNKWVSRALVAAILGKGIKGLGLQPPTLSDAQLAMLGEARTQLLTESSGKSARRRG
ncbi:MAG: polyphosphate kinase 2 family protein [Acidobacteria bacterium]|nr:polyphosphate kinase 2 family protein [Acidobacteriota bacterium]